MIPPGPEHHISSLVVHARPADAPAVAAQIGRLPGAEIRGGVAEGKLVVTLETDSEAGVVEHLNAIQLLDGVLAATLVFHHVENGG